MVDELPMHPAARAEPTLDEAWRALATRLPRRGSAGAIALIVLGMIFGNSIEVMRR